MVLKMHFNLRRLAADDPIALLELPLSKERMRPAT
jgi:hypothetical protein